MRSFEFDDECVPEQNPALIGMIKDASRRLMWIVLVMRAALGEPLAASRAGNGDALVAGILQSFMEWAWADADELARNLHIVTGDPAPSEDEIRDLRSLMFSVTVGIVAALAPEPTQR